MVVDVAGDQLDGSEVHDELAGLHQDEDVQPRQGCHATGHLPEQDCRSRTVRQQTREGETIHSKLDSFL